MLKVDWTQKSQGFETMGMPTLRRAGSFRYPVPGYNEGDEGQGTGRALCGSDGSPGEGASRSATSRASRYSSYTSRERSGSIKPRSRSGAARRGGAKCPRERDWADARADH